MTLDEAKSQFILKEADAIAERTYHEFFDKYNAAQMLQIQQAPPESFATLLKLVLSVAVINGATAGYAIRDQEHSLMQGKTTTLN